MQSYCHLSTHGLLRLKQQMSYKLTNEKRYLFDSNGTCKSVWTCVKLQTVRIVGFA